MSLWDDLGATMRRRVLDLAAEIEADHPEVAERSLLPLGPVLAANLNHWAREAMKHERVPLGLADCASHQPPRGENR